AIATRTAGQGLTANAQSPAGARGLTANAQSPAGAQELTANAQSLSAATGPALLRGPGNSGPLQRLPGATREAAAIAALLPAESVDRLDGLSASRERFLGASLEHYRFIHVASHATSDAEIPQASALILSTLDESGRNIDGRVL